MTVVNVKRVQPGLYARAVEDAQVEGWTLESKSDQVAVLRKAGGWGSLAGHAIIFVLTAWWSLGAGNLAYAVYRHWAGGAELRIKSDDA